MKNILKFLWLPVVLCACVGGNSQNINTPASNSGTQAKVALVNQSDNNDNIFTVGGTYDSMSMHPTNYATCLNIGNNSSYVQILNPHALLKLDSVANYSSVINALGVEYSAKFGWGAFSKTVSYQYARTSQDDNYTLHLNYIYQFAGKATLNSELVTYGNMALIPPARMLIGSDPVGFRQMCGDKYVSALNAGASLLMRVNLRFNSHSEKNKFETEFNKDVGLSSVLNAIKFNTSGVNYQVSLSGIQVGGNPAELNKYFSEYGDDIGINGYPEISCGTNSNIKADCSVIINRVIGYADTLSGQLKTSNDYFLYNPTVEPWENLEINPGVVNPDMSILRAMEDITELYVKDQNNLKFITEYSNMLNAYNLLSDEMKSDLQNLISSYQEVTSIYFDPVNKIMNCYNGFVSVQCLLIRDNIFKQHERILNNIRLNELLEYLQTKQYTADLAIGKNSYGNIDWINCAIAPISDQLLANFLINCDGQISGTLDTNKSLKIKLDTLNNLLYINNFNYSYKASPTSAANNFSYNITQPLKQDMYYSNVWNSSQVPILINQNNFGWGRLIMVSQ